MTSQRPQDSAQFDSNAIKSSLYGGLNTSSSALSIPTEDTPELDNIYINDRGNIQGREGTRIMGIETTQHPKGVMCLEYSTRLRYKLFIVKNGTSLSIYRRLKDFYQLVLYKANVFPDSAADLKPDYVITNEPITRIIFTTAVSAPVQLTLVEYTEYATLTLPSAVLPIEDTIGLEGPLTNIVASFVDGIYNEAVLYADSSLLVTDTLPVGVHQVDLIKITWQWWTPAIKLRGNNVYGINQRYHSTVSDASVAIPVELLLDIADTEVSVGKYPIIPYKQANINTPYTYQPNTPVGEDGWTFSMGVTPDGSSIVPGISHITFGDAGVVADPGNNIDTVHFIRGYRLFDELANSPEQLYVEVDGVEWQHAGTVAAGNNTYRLRQDLSSFHTPFGENAGKWITFDGSNTFNITSLAEISVVRKIIPAGVSTSANTDVDLSTPLLSDGQPYAVYGLHEHCDYGNNSFPRAVSLFANRLVLAGFPHRPMKVVLSSILDSIIPGRYYSNFQLVLDMGRSDAAIDIAVGSDITRGHPIVAVGEFADNLFVFTEVSSVRIRGSGTGNITIDAVTIIGLGSLGAFNASCVAKAESALIFFGPQGLYAVTPVAEIGGFQTSELSIKVREVLCNSIDIMYNDVVAWLSYSSATNRLVVGVSDSHNNVSATTLYIYSMTYKAWSRYSLLSGIMPTLFGTYVQESSNTDKLTLLHAPYFFEDNNNPVEFNILLQDFIIPMDFTLVHENNLTREYPTGITILQVRHTTTRLIRKYFTDAPTVRQATGFYMNPDPNVADIDVYLDGVQLTFNVDFYKVNATTIYIQYPMNDGQELYITYRLYGERYPIEVAVDNVPMEQGIDYDVDTSSDSYVVVFREDIPLEALVRTGLYTQVYWTTPIFVRQTLFNTKRLKDVAVLVRNSNDVWTANNINRGSGQPLDALLGRYVVEAQLHVSVLAEGIYQDFYGDTRLRWDDGMFDVDSSIGQSADTQAMSVPLLGRLKQFQLRFWSVGPYLWEMIGYQVNAVVSNSDRRRNRRGM